MQAPVPMITAQRLKGNDAGPRKPMFSMELSYPFLRPKQVRRAPTPVNTVRSGTDCREEPRSKALPQDSYMWIAIPSEASMDS